MQIKEAKELNIVVAILPGTVILHCGALQKSDKKVIKNLGARRKMFSRYEWIIPFNDPRHEKVLPGILMALRDIHFLFFGCSHGWPPASVFVNLRKKGKVVGKVKEIAQYYWGDLQIQEV